MASHSEAGREFRPYIPAEQDIPEFTAEGDPPRHLLRHPLRRRDGLPRAARRA